MQKEMLGILLCGGKGSRLKYLTQQSNKHCLPIYDEPMLFYGLRKMISAGIKDLVVVVGGESLGTMVQLLGDGRFLGARSLYITHQYKPNGIAGALGLCEAAALDRPICVYLGDNLIEDELTSTIKDFMLQESGARVLLKEVPDPQHFGVAKFENNKLVDIIEKPGIPPSNFAVIGCYMYDSQVWDVIKSLQPSGRGELEVTDINNFYLQQGTLEYNIINGFWLDSGSSFDHLLKANLWKAIKQGVDVEKIIQEIKN